MATADDGRDPNQRGDAGDTFCQGGNSAATAGTSSELERMLKQVTVTMPALSISTNLHLCSRHNIQHPTTIENLPDEILLNIFVRLLAKQLAQMRSVCKSWNALLSQSSFVKYHLHYSIHNNNDQILLVFTADCRRLFTQYSSQSTHLEPTNFIKHTPPNLPMIVIGSVNGLICLSGYCYSNIHIWNPSLSAVSAIPPYSLPCGTDYADSMRFGFDPKSDDYKLVKLTGLRNTPHVSASVKEWLRVEVYSMRKRSWKLITQPFPPHITMIAKSDYLHVDGYDGHLHWLNKAFPTTERTIVGFDLASETFHEIPLPESILDSDHNYNHLGVLARKLCVISSRNYGHNAWEVWVMEEYGVPESWVNCHVLSQFDDARKYLFGFTSRNKLLFMDGRLGIYDPIANNTIWTRTKQRSSIFVEYVDSLIWI